MSKGRTDIDPWSTDADSIPFDKEILVAWNFTNSTHTKAIVTRDSKENPKRLWLDYHGKGFILLEDVKYWMDIPEVPK